MAGASHCFRYHGRDRDLDSLDVPIEIFLQKKHWDAMFFHVMRAAPEEACGLIAAKGRISQAVYPVTNELHSTTRFRMAPAEQLAAFLDMEEKGWELAAIYHSHPKGPTEPSSVDLAEFAYPGVLYLIWYPDQNSWSCMAYRIAPTGYQIAPMEIMSEV